MSDFQALMNGPDGPFAKPDPSPKPDQTSGNQTPFIDHCRKAVLAIESDLQKKVFGQNELIRYLLMAVTLQEHLLVEGLPGEGKTYSVEHLTKITGTTHTWLQGRPDVVTSDVVGKQILTIESAGEQKGTPRLRFVRGPVFSNLLVFDEINRAPGKIQAMLLLVMQNREVTDPRNGKKIPVLHPKQRRDLRQTRDSGVRECYGIRIPDPAHDMFTSRDIRQTVIATQNPIELEGTYPLPEAQTDRFAFFVEVIHPEIGAYLPILLTRLMQTEQDEPTKKNVPPINSDDARTIPMWIRLNCLFDHIRGHLFEGVESMMGKFLRLKEIPEQEGSPRRIVLRLRGSSEQQGLLHRVLLLVYFTRWRHKADDGADDLNEPFVGRRDPILERVEKFLREWLPNTPIRSQVESMMEQRCWQFVERGSSARGLLSLVSAAIVTAFLERKEKVNREHFRRNVQATLGHRIGMTTRAETEGVTAEQVLNLLCETFLPLEGTDDDKPLIPRKLLEEVIPRELRDEND